MNLREAKEISGNISVSNSKMPGPSYAITADMCKAGSKLVDVVGSVCNKCYALRLEKFRSNVKKAWTSNYLKTMKALDQLFDGSPYVEAMVYQIEKAVKKTVPYMRWWDSGDLQSPEHLGLVSIIAGRTPDVTHYLPTKERKFVQEFVSSNALSSNLVVRVSSPMVDQPPLPVPPGVQTSTVHKKSEAFGFACPARDQGNKCGECRACWDKTIPNISYPFH
tara:strand:- start:3753 stop:4415 length:663 start_codon:yes stop_codon:yes gene_type:complete